MITPGITKSHDVFYLREFTLQHRAHRRWCISPQLIVAILAGDPFDYKKVVDLVVKPVHMH
jgi:hypothetical protein